MRKYFKPTWNVVIFADRDGKREKMKSLFFADRDEAVNLQKYLQELFYGIEWLTVNLENGPTMNMIAIRSLRRAVLESQVKDLREEDYA